MSLIINNLERIKKEIEKETLKYNRTPGSVELLAVSKTKPLEALLEAYEGGQRLFGENRVQEAVVKVPAMPEDAQFFLIGHLQSNKAAKAAELFDCIQSIDSVKIARKVNNACEKLGKIMDIYMDVNISGEESKTGFTGEDEVREALKEILSMKNLKIVGFMGIAPHVDDKNAIKESFKDLRELKDQMNSYFPELKAEKLSMGMTSDFSEAIEEGSTMVRIGSAIFGSREYI